MCMMCLKYRIILLIVIKNPWVILLTSGLLFDIATVLDLIPHRHVQARNQLSPKGGSFFHQQSMDTHTKRSQNVQKRHNTKVNILYEAT